MLAVGMKIVHRAQPSWGIGEVLGVREGGRFLEVRFPGRPGSSFLVSAKDPALARYTYGPGEEVQLLDGSRAHVVRVIEGGPDTLYRYEIDGAKKEISELEIVPVPPAGGALGMLSAGTGASPELHALRRSAVRLDMERRADALGALFGSRVMPKPHQLAVVQRVLTAPSPRFVLADEVGLGKTIEAGMIYAAMAQTGMARRVLVIAPSHLTVQWLAELYNKFHSLFTYLDEERLEQEALVSAKPAWWRYDKVVTSLELLAKHKAHRDAVGDPTAGWDLVIIDEAHHLVDDAAFDAAAAAADNTHGLLLLTATPLQLDPNEYYLLLSLVDPVMPETYEEFERRLERQGDLSEKLRKLLAAKTSRSAGAAARAIARMLPHDDFLAEQAEAIARGQEDAKEAFVRHMAEAYSLSSRLIRNRRAVVGGMASRKLVRHEVKPTAKEMEFRERFWDALASGEIQAEGERLAYLLKAIDSSPRAAAEALAEFGLEALSRRASALEGCSTHAKSQAFLQALERIEREEPGAKVLVFTEFRSTQAYLRELLARHGWDACVYDESLNQVERDRQVARFRDPEGPQVLLSTEVGGEGRNFQFCHHLVHFDLSWSPAAIEQRIGRLDRIGQLHEVRVHCFREEGTLAARVFDLMAEAVRVFDETVGGLDPILEQVEADLVRLAAMRDLSAFDRYQEKLARGIAAAREEIRRAYDPLLDARSFDKDAVQALVRRAARRLGIEDLEEDDDLESTLWAIARELDERLEETVIALARRVGIEVDTEEQVEAFQCAFRLGGTMAVDALPGFDLTEERTLLGSFWRDTAVVEEENDYFATGHPLVEALFAWIRDGEEGRATWISSDRLRAGAIGFAFSFVVAFPEPEDLAMGARVPSRQAARYLDQALFEVAVEMRPGGKASVRDELLADLDGPRGARQPGAVSGLAEAVKAAYEAARAEAERRFEKERQRAIERLKRDHDAALARIELAERRGDPLEAQALGYQKQELVRFYERARKALEQSRLELDQAAGLLPRQ